jgi:hypothetical protein
VEALEIGKLRKSMKDTRQKTTIKLFNASDKEIITDKKRFKRAIYTLLNFNF